MVYGEGVGGVGKGVLGEGSKTGGSGRYIPKNFGKKRFGGVFFFRASLTNDKKPKQNYWLPNEEKRDQTTTNEKKDQTEQQPPTRKPPSPLTQAHENLAHLASPAAATACLNPGWSACFLYEEDACPTPRPVVTLSRTRSRIAWMEAWLSPSRFQMVMRSCVVWVEVNETPHRSSPAVVG